MKPWRVFYPDVLPFIDQAAVPQPLVDQHLLRVAQQFCRETRAWRETLDPITTADGQSDYDLELPPASELVRIESASVGGAPIAVWRLDHEGHGQYLYSHDGKRVHLKQPPTSGGSHLVLEVSLTPASTALGVEDFLFDRHAALIAIGAIARISGHVDMQAAFIDQCHAVRVDLWRGNAAINPRARANWY